MEQTLQILFIFFRTKTNWTWLQNKEYNNNKNNLNQFILSYYRKTTFLLNIYIYKYKYIIYIYHEGMLFAGSILYLMYNNIKLLLQTTILCRSLENLYSIKVIFNIYIHIKYVYIAD